jgi:hypothetical protein
VCLSETRKKICLKFLALVWARRFRTLDFQIQNHLWWPFYASIRIAEKIDLEICNEVIEIEFLFYCFMCRSWKAIFVNLEFRFKNVCNSVFTVRYFSRNRFHENLCVCHLVENSPFQKPFNHLHMYICTYICMYRCRVYILFKRQYYNCKRDKFYTSKHDNFTIVNMIILHK